jgi:hypothetical protein
MQYGQFMKTGQVAAFQTQSASAEHIAHTARGPRRSGALAAIFGTTGTPRHQAHMQTRNMRICVFAQGGAEIQMLISSCVSKVSVT